MRWKIIVVNAGILIVVGLLSYVLLATSLRDILANPSERKREAEQALRAASAQLSLDGLRLERWLEQQATLESARAVFNNLSPEARSEAATVEANRIRDAAVSEPSFAKMAPTLVLLVDSQGSVVGRNGSALMRGDNITRVYPSLDATLKNGVTGSAVWLNRQRQEQLLVSYAAIRDADKLLGALVVGTPLNDERMSRTSELTSGHALFFEIIGDKGVEVLADSNSAGSELVAAASSPQVTAGARTAAASGSVVHAEGELAEHVFGAVALSGYSEQKAVIVAAVSSSLVSSLGSLLWPIVAVTGLGLVLVGIGGVLLGNYISGPVSELEDGLLAIINGNSELRFQIEHDELGGLVFRINSLLNALMGVAEDTTDDEGRPSHAPRAQDFQEALAVDESAVDAHQDPAAAATLSREPADQYYRRLFNEYIAAKQSLGDPVDHITFGAFQNKIVASEREMAQKHGRPVRYQVEVRGGSVVLNAVALPES